jgi:5-methyltetrahydrofolate--homocysteine methyltransferase
MSTNINILDQIANRIEGGNEKGVKECIEKAISQNIFIADILNDGLVKGMSIVGIKFKNNDIYLPEVLIAARAMKAGMEIIKPLLAEAKVKSKGKVVIGTVKGDLHDIGKNLVSMMLEGAGFEILDLGIDVSHDKFVATVKKEKADVIAMSALLTTTMMNMKEVIHALENAGIRKNIKVIIGGAPISYTFASQIGADGYAPDAASAVDAVVALLRCEN